MAVWVVRGGADGARGEIALENGVLTIGYGITRDLSSALTREDVRLLIQLDHPNANRFEIGQITGQAWNFKSEIKIGHLIVMPRKGHPTFAVGEMTGNYEYQPESPAGIHCRAVDWINKEVPNSSLDQNLQGILTRRMTVTRVEDGAENRLRAIAAGVQPEPSSDSLADSLRDGIEDVEISVNLEEDANNRIRDYVGRNFHGHEFTRLVAAVLQAQGYAVEVAPPARTAAWTSWREVGRWGLTSRVFAYRLSLVYRLQTSAS